VTCRKKVSSLGTSCVTHPTIEQAMRENRDPSSVIPQAVYIYNVLGPISGYG